MWPASISSPLFAGPTALHFLCKPTDGYGAFGLAQLFQDSLSHHQQFDLGAATRRAFTNARSLLIAPALQRQFA